MSGVNCGGPTRETVKVNFFDLSGHESFKDIRTDFYEGARGVLLCYDATSQESFKQLQTQWMWEARSHGLNFSQDGAIGIVCANKCDLLPSVSSQRQVSKMEGQSFAQENGFYYFELSASTGDQVVQAFNLLFEKIALRVKAERGEALLNVGVT